MKKALWVILFLFIVPTLSAEIIKSKGEVRIGDDIKSICLQAENAKSGISETYNRAKNYIVAHPTQFDADDKSKTNGFQTVILEALDKLTAIENYADTNWPGLND